MLRVVTGQDVRVSNRAEFFLFHRNWPSLRGTLFASYHQTRLARFANGVRSTADEPQPARCLWLLFLGRLESFPVIIRSSDRAGGITGPASPSQALGEVLL